MIYLKGNIRQEAGATAIEYGILLALIAVATIPSIQLINVKLNNTFCYIATQLSKDVGAGATASGCSATSSNSSGSGSGSADSVPESVQSEYNASNSYSISDPTQELDTLLSMMSIYPQNNIASMTGIYKPDGTEITTPQDYATYLGISPTTYQSLSDVYIKNMNPDTGTAVQEQAIEDMKSGNPVYIKNLSDVTFKSDADNTFTYDNNQAEKTYDGVRFDGVGADTSTHDIQEPIWRGDAGTVSLELITPGG